MNVAAFAREGYNGNPQAVKGHHSVRNRSIDRKSSAGRDGGFALGHFGCLFPLLLLTECRKPSVVQLRCQSRKCVVVPSPRNSPSQPKSWCTCGCQIVWRFARRRNLSRSSSALLDVALMDTTSDKRSRHLYVMALLMLGFVMLTSSTQATRRLD